MLEQKEKKIISSEIKLKGHRTEVDEHSISAGTMLSLEKNEFAYLLSNKRKIYQTAKDQPEGKFSFILASEDEPTIEIIKSIWEKNTKA